MAGDYIFPNRTDHKQDVADQLEKRNAEFATSHPLAWASDLMLDVLTLHPFMNGNGRFARLCFAYALMRHGIPCALVLSDWHSKARAHYIRAVREAQGQRGGHANKCKKLACMAVVGLHATLSNMLTFCKPSKIQPAPSRGINWGCSPAEATLQGRQGKNCSGLFRT
jgi:fido (protein-threonine AMPylation protein)